MFPFARLPYDLFSNVFEALDTEDILACCVVSKNFGAISSPILYQKIIFNRSQLTYRRHRWTASSTIDDFVVSAFSNKEDRSITTTHHRLRLQHPFCALNRSPSLRNVVRRLEVHCQCRLCTCHCPQMTLSTYSDNQRL